MGDPMENTPPVIRPASKGECLAVVGDVYRLLATGAETGGAYMLLEARVFPGGGPPPHLHRRESEAFYLLEGEVQFTVDGEVTTATAGTFIHVPIGVLHSFRNVSDRPARMVIQTVPAGIEVFFREIGEAVDDPAVVPGPPSEDQIRRLLEAAPRYGIEIAPPGGTV
jgi:quercetin dioxygenase-like cupin family protein